MAKLQLSVAIMERHMMDLNDLFYFAKVVEFGGFAPASRAITGPKSKLRRRVAGLEERVGGCVRYVGGVGGWECAKGAVGAGPSRVLSFG